MEERKGKACRERDVGRDGTWDGGPMAGEDDGASDQSGGGDDGTGSKPERHTGEGNNGKCDQQVALLWRDAGEDGEGRPASPPSLVAGDFPDTIQCAYIHLVPPEECERAYPDQITPNMVCAGDEKYGKDSCQVRPPRPASSTAEDGDTNTQPETRRETKTEL